ncbi:hypothetical protein LTR10_007814 [Elasticomyces elasticus]|nr:hypothetical protein LTR10_007814 [Elasticomyces elasticus]KAK4970813.1 hypothetical protein LTR42_007790 [Elasticomyces elasticus]
MAATITAVVVGAAAWLQSTFNGQLPFFGTPQAANIAAQLGPLLSSSASVFTLGSSGFEEATARWQPWQSPSIDLVVKVATEADIEHAIRVANEHGKPFLAVSGGHGGTKGLSYVQDGLSIWMRGMTSVEIAEDGRSATVGGGILSGELAEAFSRAGKQNVVGACYCTGAVAPMLGGGHGWLQGRYGLMADNLISARLTLANATTITISETSHPDLFWAARGAGQNYGIVSSFEYKIYDKTPENEKWTYEVLTFRHHQLEDVYRVADTMIGGKDRIQPVELIHFTLWMRNPEVDTMNRVILFYLIYQGSSIPTKYTQPLHDLDPISATPPTTTDLLGVSDAVLVGKESPFCAHSDTLALQRWPLSLASYEPISALRQTFNKLESLPPPYDNSAIILEAYSLHGVQAVPDESTAFADRGGNMLVSPFIMYPFGDRAVDVQGEEYGKELRDILVNASGRPLNAYVNYASGSESQEELYGHEAWRLEKLRRLKREYDPENKFGYYVGIET